MYLSQSINIVLMYLYCRYHFPFSLARFIPFYGGAEFHDYHHYAGEKTRSNFSSVFTYCDYIYGTNKVINLLSL
jgi:sterol desaturase/sphingolipid hydroxylase (fatty acid hydroxylase superfamily)